MRALAYLRSITSRLFRPNEFDQEMEEELRSHIELRADDLERSGLSRAEAERRARLEFGGDLRIREECKEATAGNLIDSVVRDVRFSARVLRKSPAFTLIAVLTLALAIGANTVVFAALNSLILRPLDLPGADSLYSLHRVDDKSAAQSYPGYLDYRDRNRSFEDLATFNFVQAGFDAGDNNPRRVWGLVTSGNYFDVLGVKPLHGRFFHAADERGPNSAPYVVLAYGYWRRQFDGDPNVVGRVVQINKHPFTVIGVAPKNFRGTLLFFSPDIFLPVVNQEQVEGVSVLNARANRSMFMMLGHTKPGVTPEQAAADIDAITADLARTYPNEHRPARYALKRPSLYGDYVGGPAKAFLTALMMLAGLILLGACANLGSLFAARASDRAREVAMRLALGASRMRIMRQLFTEAILISVAGGALGLWASVLFLRALAAWNPFPQFPINIPVRPDTTVYLVALLLAFGSGLLFGVVPVKQVMNTDPYTVVKSGPTYTAERRRLTLRDVLVVVQIAICAVLVTSSMVALRGLVRSLHSDYGFEPRNVLHVDTVLDMAGYRGEAVPAMQKRMVETVETIPGVTAVGLIDWPPLSRGGSKPQLVFRDDTTDYRPTSAAANVAGQSVSPEYLIAAQTGLLAGRNFTSHDDRNAPRVAMINREFARKVLDGTANAIGEHFKLRDGTRVQVVGMVEDGKYVSLTEDPMPALFLPLLQFPSSETTMVVRSERDPQELAAAIRSKMSGIDSGLPLFIQRWEQGLDLVLFPSRAATVALGVLGAIGAMLSITGIFGLAAYSVSKRLKELGIRIALGAQPREVLRAALGRAFKLLGLGSAAGLLLGLLASRVLASIVYQATPRDPFVLAGVVCAMLLLGLLATWIPARRALSIDPLVLLREE